MAGSSADHAQFDKQIREFFMLSVEKCAGKELPVAEKSSGKSNAVSKMLKETFDDKKMINAMDASIFPKYCDKAKKVTVDQFLNNILPDLAADKIGKGKPIDDELFKMKEKMTKKCDEWKNATKGKSAAVVDRLTDVKGYTGSHKERFDAETGKGKGMEGRVEKQDTSGYVGAYKGSGTYDKSH